VKVSAAAAKYRAARHAISAPAPSLKQGGVGSRISFVTRLRHQGANRFINTYSSCPSDGHREITWKQLGTLEDGDKLLQDSISLDFA
jgi:hypothetical protein